MPDMRYDVTGLHHAAAGHGRVAAVVDAVTTELARIAVQPSEFGGVPAAAVFADGLARVREIQGRASAAESASRQALAERVGATAGLGSELTTTSTAIASSVAHSISSRM